MLKQKVKKLEKATITQTGSELVVLPNQVANQVIIPPNIKCMFFDEVFFEKYEIQWKENFERFKIKGNDNIKTEN